MDLPQGIELLPITEWENGHQNFTVQLKPEASFKLRLPKPFNDPEGNYKATTANFQWLIKHAIDNNIRLRALGNGWSFTDVGVCSGGGIVDTKALRVSFTVGRSFLSPDYLQDGRTTDDLFFTQCGMSILQLNRELEVENGYMRSLKASGASNGQTIAGATSTGTHGSAFKTGAVHDTIVGLHIITGPDKHVWIERESYPVASDAFINWLGAEAIKNDDCFNAAVVSFGSFGFIHGIMLETEPIYLLEKKNSGQIPYDNALKKAINELDFEALENILPFQINDTRNELYHFEVVVNPNQFEPDNAAKGVYLKMMYKSAYHADYPKIQIDDKGLQYGDNTLGVIETILDSLGPGLQDLLVPPLVTKLFPLAFNSDEHTVGTIGETFSNPKIRGKAASAAIGIDCKNASLVLEEIVAVNKQTTFPGGIAMRFVKGTKALLGFTKFNITCVLEMDGVDSDLSKTFYQKIWDRLEELNIPYTLHWGKYNFILDEARIRKMYGDASIDTWLACRKLLLDDATQKVFTNPFMQRCGLDK